MDDAEGYPRQRDKMRVAGVDGCRGGWVAAMVGDGPVEWRFLVGGAAIVGLLDDVDAVAVDIPIGLMTDGPRACDIAARTVLGKRGVSVFPSPVRDVLAANDYLDACTRSEAACGKRLSKQTWGIVPKIAEVDAVVTRALQRRIVESHPEVCFATMTGAPLPPKRTAAGVSARLDALRDLVPDGIGTSPPQAAFDDALDALACAWTAARWVRGEAVLHPPGPPQDAQGRFMAIVA